MLQEFTNINELRNYTGNEQIALLSTVKTPLLKEILEYTYDPHKKYKIDEGKLNKFYSGKSGDREFTEDDWKMFKYTILDYLSDIKAAKDEDVKELCEYLENFTESSQNYLKQIIAKDLRLNMAIKKFQKVWPDFCVEPQVQLAMTKDDREDFDINKYSRKFDGKRMYIKDFQPYSRSNNICYIPPVEHLLNQIVHLVTDDFILDGECLYFEDGKENFQKGISLCQSKERKEGCNNICYVIFDIIPKENFLSKTSYIDFKKEYTKLLEFADWNKPTPDYSLIPTSQPNIFIARQDEDPMELMRLCKERKWEGLMQRNGLAPYEYKRSANLLKIKEMHDLEVELVDMEEGTGKHEGRLGAFLAKYNNNILRIGSGFSDELREEYWNNKDKYIGRMVKVQYFEKTKNKEGEDSLRFPVFLCFRDKDDREYLSC